MKRVNLALARVLGHPYFLASLALLVLNDHALKGSGLLPGAVTGKLSDVAGMFVAPALLAFVARVKSQRGIVLAHLVVAAVFTTLELSETATAFARSIVGLVGLRWHATSDWTDLLTLAFLVPSAWLVLNVARATQRTRPRELFVAAAAALACAASSDPGPGVWQPTNDNDLDGVLSEDDCNDFDATVNPAAGNCPGAATESCDNGLDDNGDTLVDCDDPDCFYACADTGAACSVGTSFSLGQEVLSGSTLSYATWALEGSCGGADSPEAIFSVDLSYLSPYDPHTLVVPVPSGHVGYARLDCNDAFEEVACVDPELEVSEGLLTIPLTLLGGAPETRLTVVLDAVDPFVAADFELPLQWLRCGNGEIELSETCDDGNLFPGDGCSELCQITTCPSWPPLPTMAEAIPVAVQPWLVTSCNPTSTAAGDHVYVFTAPEDGTLSISAQAEQHFVFLSTFALDEVGCVSEELSCLAGPAANELVSTERPMLAGETLLVVVEATAVSYLPRATFTLGSSFVPSANPN
jgi:cysteine-rich repeat protein